MAKQYLLEFTEEEYADIKKVCADKDITLKDFMRKCILDAIRPVNKAVVYSDQFEQIKNEIFGGNN